MWLRVRVGWSRVLLDKPDNVGRQRQLLSCRGGFTREEAVQVGVELGLLRSYLCSWPATAAGNLMCYEKTLPDWMQAGHLSRLRLGHSARPLAMHSLPTASIRSLSGGEK